MPGGVGAGGENPPATRLATLFIINLHDVIGTNNKFLDYVLLCVGRKFQFHIDMILKKTRNTSQLCGRARSKIREVFLVSSSFSCSNKINNVDWQQEIREVSLVY